jgi:hypothetical protein
MSLAEIKEELRRMSPADRKEIARTLLTLEEQREPGADAKPAASFAEARAYVFENYGELLRRLAQ